MKAYLALFCLFIALLIAVTPTAELMTDNPNLGFNSANKFRFSAFVGTFGCILLSGTRPFRE